MWQTHKCRHLDRADARTSRATWHRLDSACLATVDVLQKAAPIPVESKLHVHDVVRRVRHHRRKGSPCLARQAAGQQGPRGSGTRATETHSLGLWLRRDTTPAGRRGSERRMAGESAST